MANKKNKSSGIYGEIEDLYVEPPLMHRLFPTLMKGRKPSEKALAKAAAKAKNKPLKIKPQLPIADLLPAALVVEVKKRSVARAFYLLWALSFALVGAGWSLLGLSMSQVSDNLTSAEQRLAEAQLAFAEVAPQVGYIERVAEQANFANTRALDQIDVPAAFDAVEKVVSPVGSVTGYTVSFGLVDQDGNSACTSIGGGGGVFTDEDPEVPVGGIGCFTFTATVNREGSAEAITQALSATDGVVGAKVLPVDSGSGAQGETVRGEVLLGEAFRIKPGPQLTVDAPSTLTSTDVNATPNDPEGAGS